MKKRLSGELKILPWEKRNVKMSISGKKKNKIPSGISF